MTKKLEWKIIESGAQYKCVVADLCYDIYLRRNAAFFIYLNKEFKYKTESLKDAEEFIKNNLKITYEELRQYFGGEE
jgi:hypothetical protein